MIEDKHSNEVHNIRDTHSEEIATLHREHEGQRNQLIVSHEQDIARMEVSLHMAFYQLHRTRSCV